MKNNNKVTEKNNLEKVSDMFSLPKDVVISAMTIKITGCNEVVVENYCSIAEYNSEKLRIMGKKSRVVITGKNLVIVNFSDRTIMVRGRLCEVKFI